MVNIQLDRTVQQIEGGRGMASVNLENLKYTHVSEIPELGMTFRIARLYLNKMRNELGLSPVSMYPSDVRLISSEDYDTHVATLLKEDSEAIYHPSVGVSFIKTRPEDFSNKHSLTGLAYLIVHELVHEAMDCGKSSLDWDEGLTDFIARKIMKIIKPRILGQEASFQNDRMIESMVPSHSESIEVDASDAVIYLPGKGALPYSRYKETSPVKKFYQTCPNAYGILLKDHFRGTDLAVEDRVIAKAA